MNKKIKTIITLLALPCLILTSCDEDVYDFTGDTENRVYIKPLENTVNGFERSELQVNVTPVFVQKATLKLPVSSTLPVKGDVNVSFAIDKSLVEDYNEKHGTDYHVMPSEAIDLKNLDLTIFSDKTTSENSLEITVKDDAAVGLTEENYLIPIRIEKVTGNAVVSLNRNILFILVKVYVDQDNIWDTLLAESAIGNLFAADRTGWQITAVNSEFTGTANMLDGNTKTNVGYTVSTYDDNTGFTIDMLQEYSDITGVRQHFYSGRYSITSSDIYTSLDNENWTYQGHFSNSVEVGNICFYAPVKARYIKTIVRKMNRSVYIKELNIYTKN